MGCHLMATNAMMQVGSSPGGTELPGFRFRWLPTNRLAQIFTEATCRLPQWPCPGAMELAWGTVASSQRRSRAGTRPRSRPGSACSARPGSLSGVARKCTQVAQGRAVSERAEGGLPPSGGVRSASISSDFWETPAWGTAKTDETGVLAGGFPAISEISRAARSSQFTGPSPCAGAPG